MTHPITPSSAPQEDYVLVVSDLKVDFQLEGRCVKAVRDVSFSIKRGRVLAIVGESGSGKSVTAYSIMRLIQPPGKITGGTITLHPPSEPPLEITSLSKKSDTLYRVRGGLVSMIFQEPMTALSPVHTVGDQIGEAIRIHHRLGEAEIKARTIAMLEKVGIANAVQRFRLYPHELSGGMRQRVVIAMALVCDPILLIADEPTTALDVTIQAQVLQLIKDLCRDAGASVLFITHDIGVVAQIADDVAVMYNGRIVEHGTVRQVLKDPLHAYTRGLLAAIPGLNPGQRRLPTITSVVRELGADLSREYPLRAVAGGRLVALPPE